MCVHPITPTCVLYWCDFELNFSGCPCVQRVKEQSYDTCVGNLFGSVHFSPGDKNPPKIIRFP